MGVPGVGGPGTAAATAEVDIVWAGGGGGGGGWAAFDRSPPAPPPPSEFSIVCKSIVNVYLPSRAHEATATMQHQLTRAHDVSTR